MARKQRGVGGLSKEQLYNFVKVKGSQVVTNFNHDPAKNANSVILRIGTGDTDEDAAGRVRSGFLYQLNNGVWELPDYATAAVPTYEYRMLLGIALGAPFGQYNGTPQDVGMLIQGVTTTVVFGLPSPGRALFVMANASYKGYMQIDPSTSANNVIRFCGYSLGYELTTIDGSTRAQTLVLFQPSDAFAIYGTSAGSSIYQNV